MGTYDTRGGHPLHDPSADHFPACDVCGHSADDCVCPECPTCGTCGDPNCYEKHGLIRLPALTGAQRAMLLGYLYAAGFDGREKRRPTKKQWSEIQAAQRPLSTMTGNDKAAVVFKLAEMKLIERRDGRWLITELGRAALSAR